MKQLIHDAKDAVHTARCEVKQRMGVKLDPANRKFANNLIGMLAQLTLVGEQKWEAKPDGSFTTRRGAWNVTIADGNLTCACARDANDAGTHALGTTQTGRLLHMQVTVPQALESDRKLREMTHANLASE